MKNIFLFAWALCLCTCMKAQDTTAYPAPYEPAFLANMNAPSCPYPGLVSVSVIHYQQGTKAFLEFTEPVQQIRIMETTQAASTVGVMVNANSKLLEGLLPNKKYQVSTLNACGVFEPAGIIDTKTGEKEMLDVSADMYKAIRDFQQQSTVPLRQFLAARTDVSFFEKVSFIQKFYLNGLPISTFSPTVLPVVPPPSDCKCQFVFNQSQTASPGTLANGTITSDKKFQAKQPMHGNEYNASWWNKNSKGPAKWHQLWTEGSKAGGAEPYVHLSMGSPTATSGTNYAQLRYNYLCVGYNEVPANCQCDKELTVYWNYETEVCAHAEPHNEGTGSRNAMAAAEDLAVVVLHRDGGTPVVLDGGLAQAKAECSRTVNPEFWVNVATAVLGIANVIYQASENSLNQTQIDALTTSITTVISTPYFDPEDDCNSDNCLQIPLCSGSEVIPIVPNEAFSVYLYSNTNLIAGGKRSWFSWSRALSNFHLVGYLKEGYNDDEEGVHCCTNAYGNWVLGSEPGAPKTTDEVKGQVGTIFAGLGPQPGNQWNLPSWPLVFVGGNGGTNTYIIPYEYSSMYVPFDCTPPQGPTGITPRSEGISGENTDDALTETCQIRVFDLSGRLVFEKIGQIAPTDLRSYLKTEMPARQTGIYMVETISKREKKVSKIFME